MKRICKTCFWNDWIDDEEPDNDPCKNCCYDPEHYNWKQVTIDEQKGQVK